MDMRLPGEMFEEACQRFPPEEKQYYKGRHDLSGLPPVIRDQLRFIQETFTESLGNEKQDVPGHVDHSPFHVDYVDSSVPNAIVFPFGGYSFIGVTIPLISCLSDVCLRLSKSATVAALLGFQPSTEDDNELQAVLFSILISFVVAHEYTHIVHGHIVLPSAGSMFPNEILDAGCSADLEAQIQEVVADGYSIYHVLANFLDGSGRSWLTVLNLDPVQTSIQDEVLLSLVVLAVGAYWFLRPSRALNSVDIYKCSHPPQVARMHCLIQEVMNWCRQNRPALQSFMTPNRFQQLMNAATQATLGMTGAQVCGEQVAFFQSEDGVRYRRALASGVNAYKESFGTRRQRRWRETEEPPCNDMIMSK